jgi:hypothetical protein
MAIMTTQKPCRAVLRLGLPHHGANRPPQQPPRHDRIDVSKWHRARGPRYAGRMEHEDHRTTITIPAPLLTLLDQLRAAQALPKGLRKDNAATIWLAEQHAQHLLAELAKKAGQVRK